ncbi:NAD(P)/FAD-dependent oxidoreductase [Rhizobium sp. BE258]|uniref:FAD-dependent oxidoreductase n=1 Tax=Rhizobium sp. BE258 TaxID=2817722 RepID=UPI002854FF3A|nr:NAD(P)/FAD-dependent oxidoreductase [Rhizobium sp. BE258]MDR7144533.1 2-polyprenyl-6-methoxyphenol hydroxylase-like FAD-dependent oxidoreductase [Rhizobium sp. BE258]
MPGGHRDILIAGAGATGLTAALELVRRGHRPRIIDSDEGPVPMVESRALGINARTLTLLSPSRVSDVVLQDAYRIDRFRARSGGKLLFELDPGRVTGRFPAIQMLAQGQTERLLLSKLSDYEVVPEWQTVLERVENTGGTHVVLRRPDGSAEELTPDILIGADGAHSAVRKGAGLGFPGQALEESFYIADFRYPEPIDPHYVEIDLFNPGMIGRLPVSSDTVRYLSTLSDFEKRIRHPVAGGQAVWVSNFRIHFRHVERMSSGNIFLAGDAAHIHSPAGARGMNLGIEDACWLAYLISEGREQEYSGLRLPAVKTVLKQTYGLTSLVTMRNPVVTGLRNALMPIAVRIPFVADRLLRGIAGYDTPPPPWIDGAK